MSKQSLFENSFFNYAQRLGFGELHFDFDHQHHLLAIIAIHDTSLGPALGGCRFLSYATMEDAVQDALRLAHGMSYKAAMANLPLGGGKAVLVKPEQPIHRTSFFEAFGRSVNKLNGRYITAIDSGTRPNDMDAVAHQTAYVTSTSSDNGDPSPFTARGIYRGMEAAAQHHLQQDHLQGIHVAIQGIGNVGQHLANYLYQSGARLTVTDPDPEILDYCAKHYQATPVPLQQIYHVDCDIFAPCALGAILNETTIPKLNASIVVGSANNQLADNAMGQLLKQHDILYVPDYVVNAGGLIYACAQYYHQPVEQALKQVNQIYDTILEILQRADEENRATNEIADTIAQERLLARKKYD